MSTLNNSLHASVDSLYRGPVIDEIRPNGAKAEQWFVLEVNVRHEKSVLRILENFDYDALLPLYKKTHCYGGRVRDFELPLFPGYIFCRFNPLHTLSLLRLPSVLRVVGIGGMPSPVSDEEIYSLQRALHMRFPIEPAPYLEIGEKVRITGGPLTGVTGILVEANQKTMQVVLSITLLRRSLLLRMDSFAVEAA